MLIEFDDLVKSRMKKLRDSLLDSKLGWTPEQTCDLVEAHLAGFVQEMKVRLADIVIQVGEEQL